MSDKIKKPLSNITNSRTASHPPTPEQVKLFIREGEGLTVEFKEHYTSRVDEDIVAFANSGAEHCCSVCGMTGP